MEPDPVPAFRIGMTGSPGAGKSSLISALAGFRVGTRAPMAILAIDPTSPYTSGSLLGDRIRMDAISRNSDIYIRSLPSRSAHDGLCMNMEALLRAIEREGFLEIMLETVGAGQSQHNVARIVDTVVVVLSPYAGDSIQAMKAGLMEMADIYVVNKADLPEARRTAAELRNVVQRGSTEKSRQPPVIITCATTGEGVSDLSQAIEDHRANVVAGRDASTVAGQRKCHHVSEILQRRLEDAIGAADPALWSRPLSEIFRKIG